MPTPAREKLPSSAPLRPCKREAPLVCSPEAVLWNVLRTRTIMRRATNSQMFGDKAAAKGVKVVHCCGYDSIPSDMGALMMVDYIKKQLGKKTDKVCVPYLSSRASVCRRVRRYHPRISSPLPKHGTSHMCKPNKGYRGD